MARYSKPGRKTLTRLLSAYDISNIVSITPMDGGQANSSFRIDTRSGTYTLSVCDEKSPGDIQCLTRVLDGLEAGNFPATRLVKTREGLSYILHDGIPVYVKQYLPGQVMPALSDAMAAQVGQTMAALHVLEPLPDLPTEIAYGINAFDELFDMDLQHPYVDWLKEKKTFLETAMDPAMPKGWIHGDLFLDNLLFSSGTLSAVLDFEETCWYYKLYDIGMCTAGCCSRDGQFLMPQVRHLVNGYQQVCPLSPPEKKQLKVFMEYAAVAASFWRFRQYHIRRPSVEKQDSYRELTALADQVHAMDEGLFDWL